MIRQRVRALAATVTAAAMLLAGTPAMAADTFTDLAGASHVDDIIWAASEGIAKGYPDGSFGGMRDVTRQDMAAFLYRLAGSPDFDQSNAAYYNRFRDVTPASSHYREVLWLITTGITRGYDDGHGNVTFGGMRTVVRQDMAAFLHRYAANVLHVAEPGGAARSFSDVNPSTSHYDDIVWLSKTGITTGYSDGTFGGMRTIVRQDMAAFLHRTHDNLKIGDSTVRKVVSGPARTVSGPDTAYVIGADGNLWAWGRNDYGQAGDGTFGGKRANPVKVPGLPKIADVTTNGDTVWATGQDGTLWAWGRNNHGQVGNGDGSGKYQLTPYEVPGLPKVTRVTTGNYDRATVYATGADGTLWTWGRNDYGQVGDGTTGNRMAPYEVPGLPKVSDVTADSYGSAYAIGQDGSLWAWGYNQFGQVGDGASGGTYTNPNKRLTPYKVPGLPKVTDITADGYVLAIGADGSLWAWGRSFYGQVGDGIGRIGNFRDKPYRVPGLPNVASIAIGGPYDGGVVCATGTDGSLWEWGGSDGTGKAVPLYRVYDTTGWYQDLTDGNAASDLQLVELMKDHGTSISDGYINERLTPPTPHRILP